MMVLSQRRLRAGVLTTAIAVTVSLGPATVAVARPTAPAPSPSASASEDRARLAANKAMVVQFYDRLFNEGDLGVIDAHVRPDYIQHNPLAPDGSETLRRLAASLRTSSPELRLEIKRAVAAGDLVLVHSNLISRPGTLGNAVVDIFRVQDGKIAEHWDVVQSVPATSANTNTMFSTLSEPRMMEPDPAASTADSQRIAVAFFTEGLVKKDLTAFNRWVGGPYHQHNPQFPNGVLAVQLGLAISWLLNPASTVEVKRVVAEGDLVAIHSHYRNGPDDRGRAVVDLFRVRDGKVVEHWDVAQAVPATSANDNTMF